MVQQSSNKNYINVYDDVLNAGQCQHLIEKFEDSKQQWTKTELEGHRSFTEININLNKDWKEYVDLLYKTLRPYVNKYCEDNKIDKKKQWPEKFGFEQIRFKKYEPNGKDFFDEHVDVLDYASAKRFLVFFLYLKDNKGGHTSFPEYDLKVEPKAGRLLMFPPLWTYKHIGHKPIEEPKYIVGSYLHYT